MKLRFTSLLLHLAAVGLVTPLLAVSVGDWNSFQEQWNRGDTSFSLTGNLETPEVTIPSNYNPSLDSEVQLYTPFIVDSGKNLTIDGNGFFFGFADHNHDHLDQIARSFFNMGQVTLNNVSFLNNYSYANRSAKGGAFYNASGSRVTMTDVTFFGNHVIVEGPEAMAANGGAFFNGSSNMSDIVPKGGATAVLNGCVFESNFVELANTGFQNATTAGGGAVSNNYRSNLTIAGNRFIGNYVYVHSQASTLNATGGALWNDGTLSVSDSEFIGNSIRTSLGVASVNENAKGGAFFNANIATFTRVTFDGNYVSGTVNNYGGAIAHEGSSLNITDSSFQNNYVESSITSKGGALYSRTTYSNMQIVSLERDTFFRGNRMNVVIGNDGTVSGGRANSLYFEGGYAFNNPTALNVDFRALKAYDPENIQSGSSLVFYDPVAFHQLSATNFNFNRSDNTYQYKGRIVFTGEDFDETDDLGNWNSTANDKTNFVQHDGTVLIKEKAIVGSKSDAEYDVIGAKSYEMKKGVLEIITKGHLLASTVTFNTSGDWKNSIIRADNTGRLTSDILDISNGVSFDFVPFMDSNNPALCSSGLQVHTGTATLGGFMGIVDTRLDYYMDNPWKDSQKFLVMDFINPDSVISGEFDNVLSHQFESNVVDSEYGWQGKWSYELVTKEDGTHELYAVWTPDSFTPGPGPDPDPNPTPDPDPGPSPNPTPDPDPGPNPGIKDILPELAGGIVMNSLWSTVSNMRSLSNIALGQIDINRYKLEKCSNYWATGLGDFDMHRSVGKRDGYDYNGFGYAVGADTRLCPDNWLLGAAFGNLYGKNKSRNYSAEIKQTSYIGMIYGGWLKEFDKENALNITGTASYGVTTNKLDTRYSDGWQSRGKWDNDAMRFTLKAEWFHNLGDNWMLNTFIGAEYDDAAQKAFSETGNRPRHFAEGRLRNLALPVGMGISRQLDYSNGMKWINSLTASYLPDVYRENPETKATRLTADGYTWTARGVDVSRHAGRLEYTTRVVFNPTWSVFAGYAVEARKDAVYQDVNLGVSTTF